MNDRVFTPDELLDHVYGALEDDRAAALEAELETSPELRAALDRARDEATVLADAARMDAADLAFTPPAGANGRLRLFTPLRLLAAAAVLAIALVGMHHVHEAERVRQAYPVVDVADGVVSGPAGEPLATTARITDPDGAPIERPLVARLFRDERPVADVEVRPNDEGVARLEIPAGLPAGLFTCRVDDPTNDRELASFLVARTSAPLRAHVSTDKALYRPGEPIRIRAVALDRVALTPAAGVTMNVRVESPSGETVRTATLAAARGVGACVTAVAPDATGGQYRVVLSHPTGAFPDVVRPITIAAYRAPAFESDVELDRDSYRPGATGRALLALKSASGEIPSGAKVDARFQVAGVTASDQTYALPADGRLAVPFVVPGKVGGACFFSFVVDGAGRVETITKTVPVVTDRLIAELRPESGDLVAGLPNRVYYRVTDPTGKPADLDAFVVDADGNRVAETRVEVEGFGSFDLTPAAGETYRLAARDGRLTIDQKPLAPVASGVVLRSLGETDDGALKLDVASTTAGALRVLATCRTAPIGETTVDVAAGAATECTLVPTRPLGGVVRLTVVDANGTPRAERVVARTPPRRLELSVTTERPSYAPGDRVAVAVTARDESGAPVADALLGATCVDRAGRAMARDEGTPSFPSAVLLELGGEELENAEPFRFAGASRRAVDLLLGVRGWREIVARPSVPNDRVDDFSADPVRLTSTLATATERRRLDRRTQLSLAAVLLAAGLGGLLLSRVRSRVRGPWAVAALAGLAVAATLPPVAHDDGRSPLESARAQAFRLFVSNFGVEDETVTTANWNGLIEFPRFINAFGYDGKNNFVLDARRLKPDVTYHLHGDLDRDGLIDRGAAVGDPLAVVREYAHERTEAKTARQDFTDVLYWNPLLVTGANGTATFSFDTSDRLATFAVAVDANDARGALGSGEGSFVNATPFSVDLTTPAEIATGDVTRIPLVLSRLQTESRAPVTCTIEKPACLAVVNGLDSLALEANQPNVRSYLSFRAVEAAPNVNLRVTGLLDGRRDSIVRRLRIVPRGYPKTESRAGVLETTARFDVTLPAGGATGATLRLYPSPLATLSEGLGALLREPGGCFEQVSSTTYPNAMVLSWLSDQKAAAPDTTRRAKELLGKGLTLMAGHECASGGFEWFGRDPGHETLTAYGLMELADVAAVHPVEPELVARTRAWLFSRRDGEGGYHLAEGKYGFRTSLVPREISQAYVTWALASTPATAEESEPPLTAELARLETNATKSDDPYLIALAARALADTADAGRGATLRERLAKLASDDGSFTGTRTSITASGGRNLTVETTALAVLALADDARFHDVTKNAVDRLLSARRDGGAFGATQATVLALKALLAYARHAPEEPADRTVTVRVNGRDVTELAVSKSATGAVTASLAGTLHPGANRVELRLDGTGRLPWSATIDTRVATPPSSPHAPLAVTTKLAAATVREGDTVRLDVAVSNRRAGPVPMSIVRVGLPAGLEPRLDQLKELRAAGTVAFCETRPREVTLYWRGLAPKETKRVALDLVAATPGTYEGPATSAYLYYDDDAKSWAEPLESEILTR